MENIKLLSIITYFGTKMLESYLKIFSLQYSTMVQYEYEYAFRVDFNSNFSRIILKIKEQHTEE